MDTYSWKVHLLPLSGWRGLIIIPAFFLAGLLGLYLGGVILLFLAILFLILSLREFLFPIYYQISPEGIRERGFLLKREVKWNEVKETERKGRVVRIKLDRSLRWAEYFNIYLNGDEEEIWKRIESWRMSS